MQVTSLTRTDSIFRALLPDANAHEREELRASGVSASRITSLYPYDLAALNDGLRAYMAAGKRITLRHDGKLHESISAKTWPLYDLLPYARVAENSEAMDDRQAENWKTVKAILNHPAITFNEERPWEGFAWYVSGHKRQADCFLGMLNVGLLYAQQLPDTPEAGTYLESLVDTYLPDLLGKR